MRRSKEDQAGIVIKRVDGMEDVLRLLCRSPCGAMRRLTWLCKSLSVSVVESIMHW